MLGARYQLGCDAKLVRESPELADFAAWLNDRGASGLVRRQEVVSMVAAPREAGWRARTRELQATQIGKANAAIFSVFWSPLNHSISWC